MPEETNNSVKIGLPENAYKELKPGETYKPILNPSEPQVEVTVFGTYKKAARQLAVGSAFENLTHSFTLGSGSKVVFKNILGSLIALGVFAAATVYGHLVVLGMSPF